MASEAHTRLQASLQSHPHACHWTALGQCHVAELGERAFDKIERSSWEGEDSRRWLDDIWPGLNWEARCPESCYLPCVRA